VSIKKIWFSNAFIYFTILIINYFLIDISNCNDEIIKAVEIIEGSLLNVMIGMGIIATLIYYFVKELNNEK